MTDKLASERVILSAPMSFAGSARRAWRLVTNAPNTAARWAIGVGVVLVVIPLWWVGVAVWYGVFGILVVPFRLIRRGDRKRRAEELRHREALDAASNGRSA
jgi:Flp pilus assembly protein TadB